MGKKKEIIRLDREAVIPILKPKLIDTLTALIEDESGKNEFKTFCKKVEYTVRAWHLVHSEDMMQLYSLFDPVYGLEKQEETNTSDEDMDVLEQRFLKYLFQMMEKSNFKIATNEEIAVALAGKYRLNLPIKVDESKIDKKLLKRYFEENPHENLPFFADQYIIFRCGIGMDKMTAYFLNAKADTIISRIVQGFLRITGLKSCISSSQKSELPQVKKEECLEENPHQLEDEGVTVERIRIQNMHLTLCNLFSKVTIQEPTFENIIVLYRLAPTTDTDGDGVLDNNRGIYIKHFKNIPMADMEIVLPEKKNPGLTPLDWVKFLVSAVIGLVTVATQLAKTEANIKVLATVCSAVVGYILKTYLTFQSNLSAYQNLITRSMYNKQLDSGRGTLLHLCDNAINQEIKEVILAAYVLIKEGAATKQELDQRCEQLLKDKFDKICNFDIDDAVYKLEKLDIVTLDSSGRYTCASMKKANDIIGTTTEELVIQAEQRSGADHSHTQQHTTSMTVL